MPISVIEVVELSQEVVETKRDNTKLVGRVNDLKRELKLVQSGE